MEGPQDSIMQRTGGFQCLLEISIPYPPLDKPAVVLHTAPCRDLGVTQASTHVTYLYLYLYPAFDCLFRRFNFRQMVEIVGFRLKAHVGVHRFHLNNPHPPLEASSRPSGAVTVDPGLILAPLASAVPLT